MVVLNERKKVHGKNCLKKIFWTIILSNGVPFHNRFGLPSEDMYCKKEVVEVILVEIPGVIKDEYLFRLVQSVKPLPSGSKVRINVRSSSVQENSPESILIAAQ